MIKLERTSTFNWEGAIRGMRNAMNSWDKSDSRICSCDIGEVCHMVLDGGKPACEFEFVPYCIGKNDLDLMKRLAKAGSDHRKYMRQIFVSVDITAPLYWWKEFDTYKVGTTANSTSTMHTIHKKEFTLDDFSFEHLLNEYTCDHGYNPMWVVSHTLDILNHYRVKYTKAKEGHGRIGEADGSWWQMIQLLPSSYNQKRTVTMNYENLVNMYHARKAHKLDEWHKFCDWIKELPYSEIITGDE